MPTSPSQWNRSSRLTTAIFSVTLGFSSALLFWIQPLLAKTLLPVVGGAPAIWHTVLVFFQAMLLLGYGYAHWLASRTSLKQQGWIHGIVLIAALAWLPFARSIGNLDLDTSAPQTLAHQLWWGLFLHLGLPCLLIGSTAPLLQHWYSRSNTALSSDPYFLYAASNVGSLLALAGFPLIAEPFIGLTRQWQLWSASLFGVAVFLIIAFSRVKHTGKPTTTPPTSGARPKPWAWFGLAFLGSSLMLGATSFLATEVMNAPQLALLPLAAFIVSYIAGFARHHVCSSATAAKLTIAATLAVLFQRLTNATDPAWLVALIHVSLVLFGCLYLHLRLAQSRPAANELTRYYLILSLGGVVAGLVHTFVAPQLFDHVWEYPLTLIACSALLWVDSRPARRPPSRWEWAAAVGSLGLFALFVAFSKSNTLPPVPFRSAVPVGIAVSIAVFTSRNPRLWSGVVAGLVTLGHWHGDGHGKTLFLERNFFGVSRVTLDPEGGQRRLIHGNTIHGRQSTDAHQPPLPLSYYHQAGPLRRIFKQYEDVAETHQIAAIGLGAGSMLFYGQPQQHWTLYEIDPLVIQIAQDTRFFNYLEAPSVAAFEIIPGDARLQLQHAPDAGYDLILLDAFSSDSIPVHLLTREALKIYLSKLSPNGILAFHISNRTLRLEPILSRIASELALEGLSWNDPHPAPNQGKDPSHWAALSRNAASLAKLRRDERWRPLKHAADTRLWTDDRSNLFEAWTWTGPTDDSP